MNATGSSVMTSIVPAPVPSVPSLSAIGTIRVHIICSTASSSLDVLSSYTRRNVHDPRALAAILEKAEEELARKRHPDPYIRAFSKNLLHIPQFT